MVLTWNFAALIVMTGLFSAPHCIGMCGGIVSSVTMHAQVSAKHSMLYYNVGRILSYTLMGAMMGAVGSFLDLAGKLAGVRGMASIIGGCFVLLWLWRRFQLPFMNRLSALLHRTLTTNRDHKQSRGEVLQLLATGIAFGFMPCGLTYAMQMNAAASGSIGEGAVIMALFGLSTFPALAAAASIAAFANRRWRSAMRKAGIITAIAVGVLSIMRGLTANGLVPTVSPWLW